jgi:hypothetical protein
MTDTQTKWVVGGGIGALTLGLGYFLFKPRFGEPRYHQAHDHRQRQHHHDHDENERGEYGNKKRHKGHHHG